MDGKSNPLTLSPMSSLQNPPNSAYSKTDSCQPRSNRFKRMKSMKKDDDTNDCEPLFKRFKKNKPVAKDEDNTKLQVQKSALYRGEVQLFSKPLPPLPRIPKKSKVELETMKPSTHYDERSSTDSSVEVINFERRESADDKMKSNNLQYFRCEECHLFVSSQVTLETHYAGAKHAKKVRELNLMKNNNSPLEYIVKDGESSLKCTLCNISVTSLIPMNAHINGVKHRAKVERLKEAQKNTEKKTENALPRNEPKKEKEVQKGSFHCDLCNISANSQQQYEMHLGSKKHGKKCANFIQSNSTQSKILSSHNASTTIPLSPIKHETLSDSSASVSIPTRSDLMKSEILPYDAWDPHY